jgi:hypothetical protein
MASSTSDWSSKKEPHLCSECAYAHSDWSIKEVSRCFKHNLWLVCEGETSALVSLLVQTQPPIDWSVREKQVPWLVGRCKQNPWLFCEAPWLVCRCKHNLWLVCEGETSALVGRQVQTQPVIGLWGRNKCPGWSAWCKHNPWLVCEGEMRALVGLQVQT